MGKLTHIYSHITKNIIYEWKLNWCLTDNILNRRIFFFTVLNHKTIIEIDHYYATINFLQDKNKSSMTNSVLFPAVMIKILNFGTCFITSMPIKTQNDTYKSISLTSLKTQWDFVLWLFWNGTHHICSLRRRHQKTTVEFLLLLLHCKFLNNSQILIYWEILNIGTEGWIYLSNFSKIYTQSPPCFLVFLYFFWKRDSPITCLFI